MRVYTPNYTEAGMSINAEDEKLRQEIGRICACFNLRRAARLVTQRYDEAVRELGLRSTQLSVLVAVLNLPDLSLSKMARMLGMDRTSLTRNLQVLERRGLVAGKGGEDKREKKFNVTPTGIEILEKAIPFWRKAQSEVVEALGEEKFDNLLAGLHEVSQKFG